MFIERVYERRHLIPKENESCFHRKEKLNTIELLGLEAIAVEFIVQYEFSIIDNCINDRREEIRGYMRWNESSIDILDGYYDTYEFDGYLFGEVWMTENGIPMLTVYVIPEDLEDDWEYHDYIYEFETVYFRLD